MRLVSRAQGTSSSGQAGCRFEHLDSREPVTESVGPTERFRTLDRCGGDQRRRPGSEQKRPISISCGLWSDGYASVMDEARRRYSRANLLLTSLAGLALTLLTANATYAAPLLGDDVTDPVVEAGMATSFVQLGRLTGGPSDGEMVIEASAERALSSHLLVGVGLEVGAEPGAAARLEAFNIEAQVYFGRIPGLEVDVGVVGEYLQSVRSDAGAAEVGLLLGRDFGPVRGRFNFVAEQPFTDGDGEGAMMYSYSAQATVAVAGGLALGLQAYGDLGDNRDFGAHKGHYVGPMIVWEAERPTTTSFSVEAAWLAPLGAARDESDGELRLMVELERRF